MSTYYTSKYSGEQIDEAVKKIMDGEMTGDYADRQLSNLDTPQAALANLGAGVRPNIARNPAFAVNQRNFTSDNWTSGYGPDGWDSMGIGYLTFNGSTICCYGQYICQRYETGVIKKGKYTVSALCDGQIYAEMGYWGSEIAVYAISTNYQNGIASVTLDIPSDNDEVMGYIYIHTVTSGGEITYVKIEQGSTQTLAYQDSTGAWHLLPQPESDYATQLVKCQRYLAAMENHAIVRSAYVSTNFVDFLVPIPVSFRVLPTIQSAEKLVLITYPDGVNVSGVTWSIATKSSASVRLRASKPNILSEGTDFSVYTDSGATFFSAEL